MGLDNGLVIKAKTVPAAEFLNDNFKELKDKGTEFEFDYWRKCWNMRHKMLEVFDGRYNKKDNIITLYKDNIITFHSLVDIYYYVEEVLKYFLDEEHWEEDRGSIWAWEEMLQSITSAIYNLRKFLRLVEEEGFTIKDFEVYWYDSY